MTLLVVWTLLNVLLPLTDTIVVLTCWVMLPVRLEVVDVAVECAELLEVTVDLDSSEECDCDVVESVTDACVVCDDSCDRVTVVSDKEEPVAEMVDPVSVEVGADEALATLEAGVVNAADVTVAVVGVGDGVVETPVPTGMFWR